MADAGHSSFPTLRDAVFSVMAATTDRYSGRIWHLVRVKPPTCPQGGGLRQGQLGCGNWPCGAWGLLHLLPNPGFCLPDPPVCRSSLGLEWARPLPSHLILNLDVSSSSHGKAQRGHVACSSSHISLVTVQGPQG